ncbi:MAG: XrtA-associated ATPase [Aquabacterium sp.]|uniref:XrtA/PEP-CTERM system-associated ATPase n=1 Tax=Aquabacterium sp. TaxID=1872578 RepID=UPI002728F88F|nr:XrtA/PEP-CTERM system-associated ATPase [Aquabacterium sp.]MDO9004513.1 XrtA-associated ATPase [Aquabacterium sp.]
MYETHFGFTGAPFLLNPDPSFFFDSKGHSSALSYLKFGLYQAEGFIVITGDIGAGKTTLVRTLLNDIDHEKVVAAQLVSTQLEAGDLLRASITAFGIPSKGNSKADLISTLEAYLTLLATQQKRAVLIVDEAQNLSRDAIEELRMLSNFQFGNQALLQSFLIGQPELRTMLLSRSLEQLRQRVIASYHLGPMDRDETRRYIEHRLRKVGWTDNPQISAEAFDEFYEWTLGIPRRINLLCNRVLLATFLAGEHDISAANVSRIAQEIRAEIGEPILSNTGASASAATSLTLKESVIPTLTQGLDGPVSNNQWVAPEINPQANPNTPFLLCLTGSRTGCLRASPLLKALSCRADLPPARLLHIDTPGQFELTQDWSEHLGLRTPDYRLRLPAGNGLTHLAATLQQLDQLFEQHHPAAIIVQAGDDTALAGSLAAQRHHIPIIHLEAGLRSFDRSRPQEVNGMMCDHMGELLFTSEWVAHDNLAREGIPADRVLFVGNLLMDAIRAMLPQASQPKYTLRQLNQPTDILKSKSGIGVVYLQQLDTALDPEELTNLMSILRMVSKDIPLIWPMHDSTKACLDHLGLLHGMHEGQIMTLPLIPYHKMIGLLGHSACVLTNSCTVQEEATILGIPCLTLHNFTERRITVEQGTNIAVGRNSSVISRAIGEILRGGGKKGRLPKFWDGQTAIRMAEHLVTWTKTKGVGNPSRPDAAQTPLPLEQQAGF